MRRQAALDDMAQDGYTSLEPAFVVKKSTEPGGPCDVCTCFQEYYQCYYKKYVLLGRQWRRVLLAPHHQPKGEAPWNN